MVAYNVTIDDTSPMITYTGTWSRRHPGDEKLPLYFSKSFTSTTGAQEYATLRFNGTGVWAFGGKRYNHGKYSATLDGKVDIYSGYSSDPVIQAVLFGKTGLDPAVEHSLTLTNGEDKAWFDVDYYIVQHEDTDGTHELAVETVTVDTPSPEFFTYNGNWKTDYAGAEYSNSTGAVSVTEGDSVVFSFTGTSVAVYGGVYWNHGMYTAILDGVATNYNGSSDGDLTGQTVIFHAGNLQNVSHTVTLINLGVTPTGHFGIDYVQYNYTTTLGTACAGCGTSVVTTVAAPTSTALIVASGLPSSAGAIVTGTSSSAGTPSSSSGLPAPAAMDGAGGAASSQSRHGLSHGALAGIIIGCLAAVLCIALLIWFLLRRCRRDPTIYPWSEQRGFANAGSAQDNLSPGAVTASPASPYQDVPYTGGRYPARPWPDSGTLPMGQRPLVSGGVLPFPDMPPPPTSNVTSYYPYSHSVSPPTEAGTPEDAITSNSRSTDRAYSGMGNTAPSSGAIPSILGDPAEIRVASQAYSTRPTLQSLTSPYLLSGLSPYQRSSPRESVTANSASPSSAATTASFGRRKQTGAALPPTSTPPSSIISEDQLRRTRMVVQGRLQDFGPISVVDDDSTLLPPDYSQATEPLPGQLLDDLHPRERSDIF